MAKVTLGRLFQLTQNQGRDFRRSVFLTVDIDSHVVGFTADHFVRHNFFFGLYLTVATSHEAFDRINRVRWVRDRLSFGRITHQRFTLIRERDDAGSGATSFLIRDHFGFTTLHDRNNGVGGTEVDTDDLFT